MKVPGVHIPFYKRLLSYLYPVRIGSCPGTINPVLDLFLYENRWQLATRDALYSDGDKYRPLKVAFEHIRAGLPQVRTMLLLGTGLGSAVHILHKRGMHPEATLVELDETVLGLAMKLMPEKLKSKLNPVHADAEVYIRDCSSCFDLLVVDVFIGRNVPPFVSTIAFLQHCRQCMNEGGYFVLNYILREPSDDQRMRDLLQLVFPGCEELGFGINRIFITLI